jgi:hypothetical protein
MKRLTVPAVLLALCMSIGSTAFALTVTSTQSGNWSAPSTWGGNPAPLAGDAVIINGGFTVTLDVSNADCTSIQLGGTLSNTGNGTLAFTGGSQLTVSGSVLVGASNNSGSINMTSGGTLLCGGFTLNNLGTWTPGTGLVELTASNTLPNNGITSFNNLTANAGTTILNANLAVAGNLVINPGAFIDCGVRTLTVGGDWINNGTFSGNAGTVIFSRNGNQSISGSGANNFNLIRVNMGTTNANTLEVLSTNFSAPDGFLTLSNGTFKISGTFPLTSTFILGPLYNIQPSTGLWINNPNVTVRAQAGGVSVRGVLRISAGTYNIGNAADDNLDYVAGSSIIVEGGAVNIAGHLGRNSPASTTSYTQSGGVLTVVSQGSTDITNAGFDLGTAGSSFTVSGGTIVVANATSNATDYLNVSGTTNVTGGTLQIGNAGTLNAQSFRIQSFAPVGNLLLSNATAQATKPTAQLVTSSLSVLRNVTLQSGTTLNANGLDLSIGGDWTDGGTFTPGPLVTFNGTGAQGLTATGVETFNGLTINKAGGTLTLNSATTVNGGFALTQGTLAVSGSTLILNSTVTGTGILTAGITGTVRYGQGGAGQNIIAGSYGNLVFSDFDKVLPSSGIIGIAGLFTPGAAAGHTVTGSTIDFNGGSQTIPAFTFNNLTLSGTGAKTTAGTLTVNGNLTNSPGIIFTGATILTLNGASNTNGGTLSSGTVSLGPGAALTNNGTCTAGSSLTGTGSLTQGATGVLNIGGTVDIATLSASTTGNVVNYTGAGQTIRPTAYYHLTLSGSGSPSLAGISSINGNFTLAGTTSTAASTGMTIGGNVTISPGASFDAGSFSHFVKGNWSNSGTFTAGTSTIALNGSSPQTLSSSTFAALTIDNPTGVSMAGDATVGGALTLTVGAFAIGGHSLTLNGALVAGSGSLVGGSSSNIVIGGSGSSASLPGLTLNNLTLNRATGAALGGDATVDGTLTITNGTLATGTNSVVLGPTGSISEAPGQPVAGNVRTTRNISATSGTETFGNIGADIVLNGVAPGTTSVVRKTGIPSTGNGHSSIKRYFDIAPATNAGLNSGFVFHYDTTEVTGQSPTTLEMYRSRDNGASWNNLGGTANTASRTITVTGINDFSRWSASDTSNRLGTTATPALTGISPSSKHAGDIAFTLTVNGAEFVNGKSGVLFNGSPRATTYVSSTQLTALIPASDLLVTGTFPVTVVSAGGGPSNSLTLVVTPGAPVSVSVETASDGSGKVVASQSLVSGSSIQVFSIVRDSLKNFSGNVAADSWSLQNIAQGVVAGDLVPSPNGKSAVFTGRGAGSAVIKAISGSLTTVNSGTVTVVPGAAKKISVETTADGSGVVLPAQLLASGSSLTVYAITRDSLNNFLANTSAGNWNLQNITGGVVPGDLVHSADSKSAVFTAHSVGSATILATSGTLTPIGSGAISVNIVQGVAGGNRPLAYSLEQNYPNPFNPSTTIGYQVPRAGAVKLVVYDIAGREVAELVNDRREAGVYEVRFDATGLASGVYFYRVQAGDFIATKKLILLK